MTHYKKIKALAFRKKKIETALLAAIIILSVSMLLTLSAQPAYAASGSVNYNPTVFSSSKSALVVANGGSFTANSAVSFYISSTNSFTPSSTKVGTYTLTSGATSLSNAVVTFTIPSETPGTYYLAASDNSGASFTSSTSITITALQPSISISPSAIAAGGTTVVTGSQFDPGSTVTIYLGYAGGQVLSSNVIAYTGYFSDMVTIPQTISQTNNPTYIVAQEMSSSSPNYGLTAFSSFTLQASISVSPSNIAPSISSTVTISGYGFSSNAVIASNSVTLSAQTGSITSVTNTAATTNSNGELFSLAVSFDSINAQGAVSVTITTSPSSSPTSFSAAFYVSQQNASKLGFSFVVTPTIGSTYNVGNPVTATVYNFPASQLVQIYLGSTSVGTIITGGNGYGQLVTAIPALPAGTYYPTAEISSMGLYAQSSSLAISSYFSVSNPSNAVLTTGSPGSEYAPSNALFTISAYGLNPTTTYDAYDSLVAPSGVYAGDLVTSVSVGTSSTSAIYPASNGTLIFTYSPQYTTTSSSSSTITMSGSVPAYSSNSYGYKTIATPTISSPTSFKILTESSTQTLTISNLIPFGSPVYPGTSYYYNSYLGSTPLVLTYSTSVISSKFYAPGGAFTGTFTTPTTVGVFEVNVTYYGSSYSPGIGSQYVVISVLGSSYSSGTLLIIPTTTGNYEVVGYDYYLKNPTLYYMKYSGLYTVGTEALTNGAFAVQISPGAQPGGTYSAFTEFSYSGTNYFVYSSYSILANITLSSTTGSVGSTVTSTITGLGANTYYNVYFANVLITTFVTTSTGAPSSSPSITIPPVAAGTYYLNITTESSGTVVLSHSFKVTANSDVTLITDSQYAFPGQVVMFTVSGFTAPSLATFASAATAIGSPVNYVTVELNTSYYETVPASFSSGTFKGSFVMPNDIPGSYFDLTFTAYELQSVSYVISSATGYGTISMPYTGSESDFLGLVSGNGAYILGISQSQLAQIETGINATLSVPLSELNASVVAIRNSVAEITTSFGTMTASLNSINATLSSINSGVATLETTLGQVKTSLASLNATVVALNNDTARITTAVGVFNTTLSNINATVSINNGNIATIKTDLGTFTGNVTSVSNGIATIETSLGTIQANTSQQAVPFGISFIIEIITLVLVVVAVAFSAAAMRNSNRSLRKL